MTSPHLDCQEEYQASPSPTNKDPIYFAQQNSKLMEKDSESDNDPKTPTSFLLHRHFDTIGIGNVFLYPPPAKHQKQPRSFQQHTLVPKNKLTKQPPNSMACSSSSSSAATFTTSETLSLPSFLTWEIVGTIKASPQDFIVREIASNSSSLPRHNVGISPPPTCRSRGEDENHRKVFNNCGSSQSGNTEQPPPPLLQLADLSIDDDGDGDDNNYQNQDMTTTTSTTKAFVIDSDVESHHGGSDSMFLPGESPPLPPPKTVTSSCMGNFPNSTSHHLPPKKKTIMTMTRKRLSLKSSSSAADHHHSSKSHKTTSTNHNLEQLFQSIIHQMYHTNEICFASSSKTTTKNTTASMTTTQANIAITNDCDGAMSVFAAIDQLGQQSLARIRAISSSSTTSHDHAIQLSSSKPLLECVETTHNTKKVDVLSPASTSTLFFTIQRGGPNRAKFHHALRMAYPLLKSHVVIETTSPNKNRVTGDNSGVAGDNDCHHGSDDNDDDIVAAHEKNGYQTIGISIDNALDEIIPHLYQPHIDLIHLHRLRHRGYQVSHPEEIGGDGGGCPVALRLVPTLPRDQRRNIHFVLERTFPDFHRTTDPNYPIQDNNDDNIEEPSWTEGMPCASSQQHVQKAPHCTAAIILWWSKRAQQQHLKRKRKRKEISSSSCNNHLNNINIVISSTMMTPLPHSLCVLKKCQIEHLQAIQILKSTIRRDRGGSISQTDIGMAGIKDRIAVTYQFCTFRNVSPQELACANARLSRHGIQLGRFQPVSWLLRHGDLYGNRFVIVVRNLQRVVVIPKASTTTGKRMLDCTSNCEENAYDWSDNARLPPAQGPTNDEGYINDYQEEVMVPCDRQYVEQMVRRIQEHGFINFYGPQRVGLPGVAQEVGVRPFDIGRAMLQQNFDKAIDLIIKGRRSSSDGEAVRTARNIWNKTGGDAALTLKAIPKMTMPRERAILQGIKRYGKDRPLEALRCLNYGARIFWIHAYQSYIWNKMATRRMELFGTDVVPGDLYVVEDDGKEIRREENGNRQPDIIDIVRPAVTDKVQITQVVLPLPGYDIKYPENQIGEEYRKLLQAESVEFLRGSPPEATAKGDYRRLVATVENLTVSHEPTTHTPPPSNNGGGDDPSKLFLDSMTLKFDLRSGSYATSMLRELMLTTVDRTKHGDYSVGHVDNGTEN